MTVDELERRFSWTSGRATDALDTLLDVSVCHQYFIAHSPISHLPHSHFSNNWILGVLKSLLVYQCRKDLL